MRTLPTPASLIAAQRGHLFLWAPVAYGIGIALYFGRITEPGGLGFAAAGALLGAGVGIARRAGETMAPFGAALALVATGFLVAGGQAHRKAAPVLDFRYYGPVEGRVVAVDRSISDAIRVTLEDVVLLRVAPRETPERVRVALHGDGGLTAPLPGMRVMVTAHLGPPSGPVEPGGFDFRRHAWFLQIGAVGYARTPMVALEPPAPGAPLAALDRFRLKTASAVRDSLPDQTGAFAAAVMTGDRSGLSRETLHAMRDTNLAHLLAISGLHMGLLSGFVFLAVRAGLALIPRIALRWPTKKIAAVIALVCAAGYLALSGGNVSTQRAFIMVSVMLAAILIDRRALSLRAVAFAALIVLTLRPEALLGPGFQMSFAATTALVWVFSSLRDTERHVPRWAKGAVGVVLSSAVAGLATAPVAFAHFNQSASYGLLANVVAVPLMGSLVVPAGVLAAILAPLGLAEMGLVAMGWGIDWILAVARTVSAWPGAVRYLAQPPGWVLPAIALGAMWLILWRGRLRHAGAAACLLAGTGWMVSDRPDMLISSSGALVGVLVSEGRALSRERGHGFEAMSWLENDGGLRDRAVAAALAEPLRRDGALWVRLGAHPVAVLFGRETDALAEICNRALVVVTNRDVESPPPECLVLGPVRIAETGALALTARPRGVRVDSVRRREGARLWSPLANEPREGSLEQTLERVLNTPRAASLAAAARQIQ